MPHGSMTFWFDEYNFRTIKFCQNSVKILTDNTRRPIKTGHKSLPCAEVSYTHYFKHFNIRYILQDFHI